MPVYGIKRPVWICFTLFCISMAFMESAVVVYLRELYFPKGFSFPLVSMPPRISFTEIIREAATLIILLTAGYLTGKNKRQRFSWFIFGFAVWDLFYYVFLKLLINWPESWLTWDILFLIPVIWSGPVIAPILVSLTMILLAFAMMNFDSKKDLKTTGKPVLFFVITGSVLIFLSFIWEFSSFLINHDPSLSFFHTDDNSMLLGMFVPIKFNWILFFAGEMAEGAGIWLLFRAPRK